MQTLKLYMLLLGCKPAGRYTEQHDIFFSIAPSLADLVPQIKAFWPEAKGRIHVDAWRTVTAVDGYSINVVPANKVENKHHLFFINLGGYKENEFEEFHYKMLCVGTDAGAAVKAAKQTAFYKHTGYKGAESHIDDKYGIDVDDIFAVRDILPADLKQQYSIEIKADGTALPDTLHMGYFKLEKLAGLE